jgi:LysR family glycine cleavage system transcriptional activator
MCSVGDIFGLKNRLGQTIFHQLTYEKISIVDAMARNLPPLNSLRAFEAAARHLSFTKAAEELHVTPAAVSHQIKGLEEQLGVPLFRRLTRALRLTEAGQAALPVLRDGFDKLADGVDLLRAHEESGVVTVSLEPSFAAKWLVPRLDRLRAAHPELEVRLDATDRLADFQRDNVDLAIRYGNGDYPGLEVEQLLSEEIFPVCSPKLRDGPAPLAQPADLRHHTLIHLDWEREDVGAPTWRMWLLAAGIHDIDFTRGPVFSMKSLALQAAIEGQGVALASSVLVRDDLAAGRLVVPFDLSVCDPLDFAYYIVVPKRTASLPKVAAFRGWLRDEICKG